MLDNNSENSTTPEYRLSGSRSGPLRHRSITAFNQDRHRRTHAQREVCVRACVCLVMGHARAPAPPSAITASRRTRHTVPSRPRDYSPKWCMNTALLFSTWPIGVAVAVTGGRRRRRRRTAHTSALPPGRHTRSQRSVNAVTHTTHT